jgi:NAD(P)H-dependent FMN reductase
LVTLVKILALSGSLQATSSNTRFVRAAQQLAPAGTEVVVFDAVDAIPHFNPDIEAEGDPSVLAPVTELRTRIAEADGVLIASPEYAHEMPGSLKNALDWIVGTGELYGKRVAIVCVSPRPNGGVYAREAIERTLGAQGSEIVLSETVGVVKHEAEDDAVFVGAVGEPIARVLAAFREA